MTAKELLKYELDQVGKQIDVCLKGMSEQGFDTKCSPAGMTPREMLEHLCEAYLALAAHAKGEKYEWGSFAIEDKSTDNVLATFRDLRSKAVEAALGGDEDEAMRNAYDYIVGHDNYHVSQLVLSRLQVEPEWNSYEIYS